MSATTYSTIDLIAMSKSKGVLLQVADTAECMSIAVATNEAIGRLADGMEALGTLMEQGATGQIDNIVRFSNACALVEEVGGMVSWLSNLMTRTLDTLADDERPAKPHPSDCICPACSVVRSTAGEHEPPRLAMASGTSTGAPHE